MTGVGVVTFVRSFAGPVGGVVSLGPKTEGTPDLSGEVVVCGRPYSIDRLPVAVDPDEEATQVESALARLDGMFTVLARGRDRWVLATDLLGIGGAFIADTTKGVVIASSLGQAAALVPNLQYDRNGLATTLVGSVFLEGVTPFQGIRRLQAGEYAILRIGTNAPPVVRSYANPADVFVPHEERPGSPDELRELIREAVARERPGEHTGLLLTRGKDSQALANAMSRSDRSRLTAFTYGGWRSTDRRGARHGAKTIGLAHKRVGPLLLRLADFADTISYFGGGQSGLQVAQHLAGVREIGRRSSVAMTGYLGDVLSGRRMLPTEEARLRHLQKRLTAWLNDSGVPLARVFPGEIKEMRQRVLSQLARCEDLPPGRATTLVDLTHREAMYVGGAFQLMNHYVEIAAPFFYRPLIQYLLTRHQDELLDQALYVAMLRQDGWVPDPPRTAPLDRLASWADRVTDTKYLTVNWPKVIGRERGFLRSRLARYANDDQVARLGLKSLETNASLPLALFAIPIVETRYHTHVRSG